MNWWKRGAAIVLACTMVAAWAQGDARGALRLVVPYPSGGLLDQQARLVAPSLGRHLGQDVVVDNIGGAAGGVGLQHVLAASTPGEIVIGSDSDVILAPLYNTDLKFGPSQFQLLSVLGAVPMVLVAGTTSQPAPLQSIIAAARTAASPLRIASYGVGSNSHLVAESFARRTGIAWIHVPYRGAAPLIQDLLGGTVDAAFLPLAAGVPDLVQAGKVRMLGVAAPQRLAAYPQTPTFAEAGIGDFVHRSWSGIFAPSALAGAALERVRRASIGMAEDPEVRARLEAIGLSALSLGSRPALDAFFDAEIRRYRGLLAEMPAR